MNEPSISDLTLASKDIIINGVGRDNKINGVKNSENKAKCSSKKNQSPKF